MLTKKALVPPSDDETPSPHHIPYFQFPNLSKYRRLVHAVFTRHGGVSESRFNSLNISYSTGDLKERVNANLKIIKKTIGAGSLASMKQVHGQGIYVFARNQPNMLEEPVEADAIITSLEEVALMVKQADCQAIIIFDPGKAVLANVHCGWRGNARNLPAAVVRKMKVHFGCNPADLVAGVGPSLGPCCAEFVTHEDLFPQHFRRFMVRKNYFDLWEISKWQLVEAGLDEKNIEVAGICTRCRTDLFYSYRAEGVTGRFATVAMLK